MAYRIDPEKPASGEIARVAREQVQGARASIHRMEDRPASAIHKARQHSKKFRALLRLVRPGLEPRDNFRESDDIAREFARHLSGARDAEVALATLEALRASNCWAIDPSAVEQLENRLRGKKSRLAGRDELARARVACLALLDRQEDLVRQWRFRGGARRAVERGFARTRKSARKWMARAERRRTDADFHRWRKHVKYHLYHLRLIAPMAEDDLASRIRLAYRLQKLLGEVHDLAVLDGFVSQLRRPAKIHRHAIREVIHDTARMRGDQSLRMGSRLLG